MAKKDGAAKMSEAFAFPCERCPLNSRHTFETKSSEEIDYLSRTKVAELTTQPGATILKQGDNNVHLYTVLSGFGFRYKTLEDGRRQVLNFVMPGDFIGLQSTLFSEMHHSIEALTPMTLCAFDRSRLHKLYADQPELAFDITWLAAREEQILEEHMLSIGRRSALERAAYLIAFVHSRALATGAIKEGEPLAPFTQTLVADTLGLSLVHTNKTLRILRKRELISWYGKRCSVLKPDELLEIAGWDGLPKQQRRFI